MKTNINNLAELQSRIKVLKIVSAEHELFFHQKVQSVKEVLSGPSHIFTKIKFMLGFGGKKSIGGKKPAQSDWVTNMTRVLIPYIINKTLFRKSGFIIKTVISLLSQATVSSKLVNKNTFSNLIDKATGLINSTISGKKKPKKIDYGIPPDSETY